MACHLAGVETAVASCGTAFGEDHVKLLRRLLHDQDAHRSEVIFTFDGDAAGQAAARKALAFDQHFVAQTFVAIEAGWARSVRAAPAGGRCGGTRSDRQPRPAGRVRHPQRPRLITTWTRAEGQVAALRSAVPLVAQIKDWALRDEYARRLSGWVGMPSPDPVVDAGAPGSPAIPPARERSAPLHSAVPAVAEQGDTRAADGEREALKAALQTAWTLRAGLRRAG